MYKYNPHSSRNYGDEIVLFHSKDRYKRKTWRYSVIEDLKNLKDRGKITEKLELKAVVGEFDEGAQEIIKHAINHNFESITIISGPKIFCEDKNEIHTILTSHKFLKYLILPVRPTKHYMIFNKKHLFIEKIHRHNEKRGATGIKNAQLELIQFYEQAFLKLLQYAEPTSKKSTLNQQCYIN
ncbi:hypothetical protein [Methanobacterium paludis]|uniref:Uncharacterized protein n=1 Tax=Methanobacterium paludis (strain DSM 25820 / JCM 18151 / SWAN1) TaxID=868131 RepID=F6D570_METPW|nr:hypothetical protein [Methanobacterium paludis]AEG18178.1 hypothetical protein MSWAN_1160 [Methanobacterium paludis]